MERKRAQRQTHDDALYRQVDDGYVRRGLQRRDDVRRLRLADGLPRELGGRRAPQHPDPNRDAAVAARAHLRALGLYGPVSSRVLRESA